MFKSEEILLADCKIINDKSVKYERHFTTYDGRPSITYDILDFVTKTDQPTGTIYLRSDGRIMLMTKNAAKNLNFFSHAVDQQEKLYIGNKDVLSGYFTDVPLNVSETMDALDMDEETIANTVAGLNKAVSKFTGEILPRMDMIKMRGWYLMNLSVYVEDYDCSDLIFAAVTFSPISEPGFTPPFYLKHVTGNAIRRRESYFLHYLDGDDKYFLNLLNLHNLTWAFTTPLDVEDLVGDLSKLTAKQLEEKLNLADYAKQIVSQTNNEDLEPVDIDNLPNFE